MNMLYIIATNFCRKVPADFCRRIRQVSCPCYFSTIVILPCSKDSIIDKSRRKIRPISDLFSVWKKIMLALRMKHGSSSVQSSDIGSSGMVETSPWIKISAVIASINVILFFVRDYCHGK